MLKTLLFTIMIAFTFSACSFMQPKPEPKPEVKKPHYKVQPKLSHSFYY